MIFSPVHKCQRLKEEATQIVQTWRQGISLQKFQKGDQVRLSYGHNYIPPIDAYAHGGIVKFQHLAQYYPNTPRNFNLLYMVSSSVPRYAELLLRSTSRYKVPFLWNQNGISYPGSAPFSWRRDNKRLKLFHDRADYVFYQSEFCKKSVEQFFNHTNPNSEILYNPVNLEHYSPRPGKERIPQQPFPLRLLAAGTINRLYRLTVALETLVFVKKSFPEAQLFFAGELCWHPDFKHCQDEAQKLIAQHQLGGSVFFLPPYSQKEAPELFSTCDLLLHTKYQDPCPGVVIEALACALPVVYSNSGGVSELVGPDAGIGVNTELSWDKIVPPDPSAMACAVVQVANNLHEHRKAARRRAEEQFSLARWVARHQMVFQNLGYQI